MNAVELTKKLVAINSVNPFRTVQGPVATVGIGNEAQINEYLEQVLQQKGFHTQRQVVEQARQLDVDGHTIDIPARWNLLAEKGQGNCSILFFGHTDTVDVKPGWQSDPFVATEKNVDGQLRLYGLGANDMKSGIAAVVAGIPDELPKGVKVKIALLADEEYWSFGGAALVESSFISDVKFALSPEIGEASDAAGFQQVGLGRLGRDEFVFRIVGRACHGADAFVDKDSVNAVHESIKLQHLLLDYCQKAKKEFSHQGVSAINSAYINLHEGGRGMLSVPDTAEFILDRSFIPGEDPTEELEKLRKIVADAQSRSLIDARATITVERRKRPTPSCKPFFFPKSTAAISKLEEVIKAQGVSCEYFIGRSVADENRVAEKDIPTVVLGPLGHGSHTCAEWVAVESIELLEKLVCEICNQATSFVSN